jgi:hypothetical protein
MLLHTASPTTQYPNSNTDAHNQKKNSKKTKSRYGILALTAIIHPPPRQHLNFMLFKSDISKSAQASSIARSKILGFHLEDNPRS